LTALAQKNARTATLAALFVACMVGLAFASVPLYRLFCDITGLNGTTQRADNAPGAVAGEIGVRFDANINPALPWRFEAVDKRVRIQPGGRTQISYRATNLTGRTTTGTAVFNVTPVVAGKYFSKIECFCFSEQTLRGGESVDMPVVFYVDPKIREDETTRHIDEITLSYTFYPVETPAKAR
jgi:cytochrome c oxidase assembly protein subunit 11